MPFEGNKFIGVFLLVKVTENSTYGQKLTNPTPIIRNSVQCKSVAHPNRLLKKHHFW